MTILKVDEETFSIIIMALNECGYDIHDLDFDFYDEVKEEVKETKKKKIKKIKSRND